MALHAHLAGDVKTAGHRFPEQQVDLGEIQMNYATAGTDRSDAVLLLPAQTESWWGYESAMSLLAERFQVFAVDLRGQGGSTRTPGRYTLDNMGNDLVRFIDLVVKRPVLVSGNSSGGVLAAWLAAYAKPGQIRAAMCEDPPLFASELNPAVGQSIRQAMGPLFLLTNKWLGDQWSVGDWEGLQAAIPRDLPPHVLRAMAATRMGGPPPTDGPPQNMREYDPEWGRAFSSGTVGASCDHAAMLSMVKTPLLLTHHSRGIDAETGCLMGAVSDDQVRRAGEMVTGAGQPFTLKDLPEMGHMMHALDPDLFVHTLTDWWSSIDR